MQHLTFATLTQVAMNTCAVLKMLNVIGMQVCNASVTRKVLFWVCDVLRHCAMGNTGERAPTSGHLAQHLMHQRMAWKPYLQVECGRRYNYTVLVYTCMIKEKLATLSLQSGRLEGITSTQD